MVPLQSGKSKLKILVVHEINYREKVIYEIHEFPELLAAAGHEVEFLEFAEGYCGKPGANQRSWIQTGRVYKESKLRIHSPWLAGIEALDRLVGFVSVLPILWGLRKSKFDVILNFAVPTYGLQVLLFGWITRTPVVHRALDVSHKIRKSPWNTAISLVERIVFNLATALSANNPAMAEYIQSKLWRKVSVRINLPPSLSPGMKPVPYDQALAAQLGLKKDDFVIAYLGSFFYFSGLDFVLKAFAEERMGDPRLRLLLVGGGEQERELRVLCKALDLGESVVFAGFVEFNDIPSYLSLAHVGINPMEVSEVSSFALPNKVLQYLALGLPVVSTGLAGLKSALPEGLQVSWASHPSGVLSAARSLETKGEPVINVSHLVAFEPKNALKSLLETLLLACR